MRIKSLFVAIAVAALMLTPQASAVDTDVDGLLDLLDVPGFDPSANGDADFRRRGIQDLDGANQLTNLQRLDLDSNHITSLESGDFEGLANLQTLDLTDNRITSLESGDFQGLTNLQWLRLERNQITSIESGDFQGLTNLQDLRLERNQITILESGDFDGLNNLQTLSLERNQITSIESGDFDGLTNLQGLHLNSNQITSLESGGFQGLTNLQWLRLARNQITSIESGAFAGLTNLQHLGLSGNQIIELNFTGARFEDLKTCTRFGGGLCVGRDEIRSLILDHATLSRGSFDAIVGETTSITDVSLVGLSFSDENPNDLSNLLDIATLDNVTVSQTLFDSYADEFNAFDAIDGNMVTVVPDPTWATTTRTEHWMRKTWTYKPQQSKAVRTLKTLTTPTIVSSTSTTESDELKT
jgi:hypothetical protein